MTALLDRIAKYQAEKGQHWAGTCSGTSLARLEWFLTSHFGDKELRTLETGCGASTIVFAHYASQHSVYCYDDRQHGGQSSVLYAQHFSGFHADAVRWVFGPTQRTLFENPLDHPVDVIQIDGPHGYPFPDVEYFALARWLTPGGVLVLDDVHIPTINNLHRFLIQDDAFRLLELAQTTAFFERTELPAIDPEGDDWWLQRYNVQGFPAIRDNVPEVGFELPLTVHFDGRRANGKPLLTKGFSLLDSVPVSEGRVSQVTLRLAETAPERVSIALDIQPIAVEQREGCGLQLHVGNELVAAVRFDSSERQTISVEANSQTGTLLALDFTNTHLRVANELTDWQKSAWYDGRLPNFRLHAITVRASTCTKAPRSVWRTDGSLAKFDYDDQQFSFFVDDPEDCIQAFHAMGRFYELEALERLRNIVPEGARILDVGAHVGNSTVFFGSVMRASRVVAIEPSPRAGALLRTNAALNQLRTVDLAYLGKALGRRREGASLVATEPCNSGGARLHLAGGPVPVHRGDDLFATDEFDLIKIDAPGMELDVLDGLAECIQRSRPVLCVELPEPSRQTFAAMMAAWNLQVVWERQLSAGTRHCIAAATHARTSGAVSVNPRSALLKGVARHVRRVHRRVSHLAGRA